MVPRLKIPEKTTVPSSEVETFKTQLPATNPEFAAITPTFLKQKTMFVGWFLLITGIIAAGSLVVFGLLFTLVWADTSIGSLSFIFIVGGLIVAFVIAAGISSLRQTKTMDEEDDWAQLYLFREYLKLNDLTYLMQGTGVDKPGVLFSGLLDPMRTVVGKTPSGKYFEYGIQPILRRSGTDRGKDQPVGMSYIALHTERLLPSFGVEQKFHFNLAADDKHVFRLRDRKNRIEVENELNDDFFISSPYTEMLTVFRRRLLEKMKTVSPGYALYSEGPWLFMFTSNPAAPIESSRESQELHADLLKFLEDDLLPALDGVPIDRNNELKLRFRFGYGLK